jgi:Fic family protein
MQSYIPEKLPPASLDYRGLIGLVGEASAALARYDGLLQAMVNPEILLSPLTTKEAVLSSRIEGTQATMDEVLQHEAGMVAVDERKQQDIQEIVNYRFTLLQAEKELKNKPLSLFFIRQMHKALLSGVRGVHKEPGTFRDRQNWIGKPGTPIERADYIPPEPHLVQHYMDDLEQYIQSNKNDVLLHSAVIHAQFELIHPFLDGNGRIGRLLIPLFLYYRKRLTRPMFYISEYLESNRDEYYARLGEVSISKDWNGWLEFYLQAIQQQGKKNADRVLRILELYQQMRTRIRELARTQYGAEITDALFDKPIFRASDVVKKTNIPKQTIMPVLKHLLDAKIIIQIREARGRRPAVLKFPELLAITEG